MFRYMKYFQWVDFSCNVLQGLICIFIIIIVIIVINSIFCRIRLVSPRGYITTLKILTLNKFHKQTNN